jgi:hypothetical protein
MMAEHFPKFSDAGAFAPDPGRVGSWNDPAPPAGDGWLS